MTSSKNNDWLDEIRRRVQETLSQAKRDRLRDEYGMEFVLDVFTHEKEYFLPGLANQPLFNAQGEPVTTEQFQRMVEAVWERLPPTNCFEVKPITTEVDGDEGEVWALITWDDEAQKSKGQVESFFRLQPSPYTGWDVVQTSLLDDLLA